MAALIRKQMPPIKKRIKSQITEARAIEKKMAENPADCQIQANRLLVKLQKNAIAYEELDKQLVEKAANDDGESARILEEAEATAELMLETNDAITDLELLINEIKESEKLNKEAEKEKLNIEFEQKLRITQMEKEMEFRETIERECAIKRELEMATRSEIRTTSTLSVRLPKLDFAKFNGNILKWQEFWDSFEAAIHENISLKAVDKLNYLKAQLTGEATNVLSGLELTNENYEVAVNILKCRYGKKNVLINAHYSALMDLPIARNQTNRLREVTDSIEKHLRSLDALGEDINHHYFTSMIMSKLPKEIILKLEEQKDNDDWSVQELRGKIQKILAAKEIVDYQMSSNVENKGINEVQNKMRFTNRTTTETLFTGGAVNTENKKLNNKGCIYCKKKNHWSDECYKYASINERKQIIKGACYICLKKGHMQKDCKLNKLCIYCNQKQNHHRSLCPKKFPNYRRENAGAAIEVPVGIQQNDELTNEGENSLLAGGERVLLQTATTIIKNSTNGKETLTKLILDTGSQRSYISEGMVDLLKLNKKSVETLSVFTFGSQKPKIIKTPIVEIEIQLMNKTNMKINVNVVPQITGRIQQASFDLNKLTYLCKQLPLADKQIENSEIKNIGLLLGNDYYWDIITSEKIKIKPGLYLIGSTLGWILSGRITEDDNKLTPSMMLLTYSGDTQCDTYPFCKIDQALSQQFNENEWWDLQTIGIKDGFEVNEDDKALQNFNDTIKYYNKRYLVTWPWKDLEQNLKENYHLAHGRLMSLLKRYKDRPDIIEKYDATIKDQLNKGIIEIVNKQTEQGTKKHYIPHHAVINPSKTTTSLRIVYDGSAKANKKDKSINECLYRGPVMLENMCGLLMRFRMNRIAVVADIEKAFLQVGLQPGERDVTRFLWLKDSKEPGIQENI